MFDLPLQCSNEKNDVLCSNNKYSVADASDICDDD